jgi:predicted DNA-binding transcriptional regulator AlpA
MMYRIQDRKKGSSMSVILDGERYLDENEVLEKIKMSRATLYIKMKYENFPKPKKQKKAWKESDIEEYLEKSRKHKIIIY